MSPGVMRVVPEDEPRLRHVLILAYASVQGGVELSTVIIGFQRGVLATEDGSSPLNPSPSRYLLVTTL